MPYSAIGCEFVRLGAQMCAAMVSDAEWCEMVQSCFCDARLFDVRGQLQQRMRGDSTASDAIHGVP